MKILVVGSGGREHALVWKLSQEAEVICAPGNPGIAQLAQCFPIPVTDIPTLVLTALEQQVDLVVVGPEDPLIEGLADAMRSQKIPTFGPGGDAAQLEGSKAFSKDLMHRAGVPTARFETFTDPAAAKDYAKHRYAAGIQLAVKASGNALGKGVVVTHTLAEAEQAIDDLTALGKAGETLVIEDRLNGKEFSLLTLVSGQEIFSLPVAQDHKRVFEHDQGPNTGGMGTFSPVHHVDAEVIAETEELVVRPILRQLAAEGLEYRGMLFSGLMFHNGRVNCLEYNVRFGDPETQSIMLRLGKGFAQALLDCALGRPITPTEILDNAALTVVVASKGYPGAYEKGHPIRFGSIAEGVVVFHAGTALNEDQLVTNGGRVLGVSAAGPDLATAYDRVYAALDHIQFEGMQFRRDIGRASVI